MPRASRLVLDILPRIGVGVGRGLPRLLAKPFDFAVLRLRLGAFGPLSWRAMYHFGPDMKRCVNSVRRIALKWPTIPEL